MQPPAPLEFETIPLLKDNYGYLIVDSNAGTAVVVDPSEAKPVLERLKARNLSLAAIWNTHHHWDHVGGNEILQAETNCHIVGSALDQGRIPGQTHEVSGGDQLEFGGYPVEVIFNPGHTLGAVSYVISGRAYTGDTLFLAGCGRLFEGSPLQMWQSLCTLRQLPPDTLLCCGHEYTVNNLRFAAWIEPGNSDVLERLDQAQATRENHHSTVPATLEEDLRTNPFLRADVPSLLEGLARHHSLEPEPGVETFATLRRLKDGF